MIKTLTNLVFFFFRPVSGSAPVHQAVAVVLEGMRPCSPDSLQRLHAGPSRRQRLKTPAFLQCALKGREGSPPALLISSHHIENLRRCRRMQSPVLKQRGHNGIKINNRFCSKVRTNQLSLSQKTLQPSSFSSLSTPLPSSLTLGIQTTPDLILSWNPISLDPGNKEVV